MTALAMNPPYAGVSRARQAPRTGVSSEAGVVFKLVQNIAEEWGRSATGQARLGEPMEMLLELQAQCAADDWDGEGASAVTPAAFSEARELLLSLPSNIPTPQLLPEPTGAIGFEWYRNPNRVFVASVSGTKSIDYAGLFGPGNEVHGKVHFADSLPQMLVGFIRMVV